jgi:hypothetical protein
MNPTRSTILHISLLLCAIVQMVVARSPSAHLHTLENQAPPGPASLPPYDGVIKPDTSTERILYNHFSSKTPPLVKRLNSGAPRTPGPAPRGNGGNGDTWLTPERPRPNSKKTLQHAPSTKTFCRDEVVSPQNQPTGWPGPSPSPFASGFQQRIPGSSPERDTVQRKISKVKKEMDDVHAEYGPYYQRWFKIERGKELTPDEVKLIHDRSLSSNCQGDYG